MSLVKKRVGDATPTSGTLPPLRSNGLLRLITEEVFQVRASQQTGSQLRELLVQWKDLPKEDATWEDFEHLKQSYPDFNLEDKIHFGEGSNDASSVRDDHVAEPDRRVSSRTKVLNRKYLA